MGIKTHDDSACTTILDEGVLRTRVAQAVRDLRETRPMVGSITNAVTMEFVANAQLACEACAAMVYLPDEGAALARMGGALYVNLGTLLPLHRESIPLAARTAHELGRPWVLDPVGIGIGELRADVLAKLRACRPTVVRANASEVIALARAWELLPDEQTTAPTSRVVETTDAVDVALPAAVALARWTGGAVAVSGPTDLVCDGHMAVYLRGGSPLMERTTGFGCSLGGVVAGYAAATDPLTAACAAVAHYNVAGTQAATRADAPASFKVAFLDELFSATPEQVAAAPLTTTTVEG